MGDEVDEAAIIAELEKLQKKADDLQTQVYIISGVFGAVTIFLILAVTILIVVSVNLNKRLKDNANRRRIAEEMNSRRFSAYTGEEIQRQLTAATMAAANPLPTFQPGERPILNSAVNAPLAKEYAFNTPNQGGNGLFTLQNPRQF